jgi:hypothetical protein
MALQVAVRATDEACVNAAQLTTQLIGRALTSWGLTLLIQIKPTVSEECLPSVWLRGGFDGAS